MLLDPDDSTGTAQLSQIETERLLAELVEAELDARKKDPSSAYKGGFSAVCFYLGYQARSALPSNFDCTLAYTLGSTAIALIKQGLTGYLATARGLTRPVDQWVCG